MKIKYVTEKQDMSGCPNCCPYPVYSYPVYSTLSIIFKIRIQIRTRIKVHTELYIFVPDNPDNLLR